MRKFKRGLGKFLQYGLMIAPHAWLIHMMGLKYYMLCLAMLAVFLVAFVGLLLLIDWLKK